MLLKVLTMYSHDCTMSCGFHLDILNDVLQSSRKKEVFDDN